MSTKANVEAFNGDVEEIGTYQYSDSSRDIAKQFSNGRTSRAIAEATSFAGKRVLDVGCGDGIFTVELAKLGPDSIFGIDPAANAIASAKQRAADLSNVTFDCVNVYDLNPAFGRFDIAVVRGVLHHLAEPDRALKAIASVAEEIVIMEPNGCNPVLKLIERFSAYHIAHEEQSFFPWTIDRWLRGAGKEPLRREIINLVPLFCPAWFAKLLKTFEPIVERVPLVRLVACGQYIIKGA